MGHVSWKENEVISKDKRCVAHQYSQVGFNSSVEVNEVNLSLYYGGVGKHTATVICANGAK